MKYKKTSKLFFDKYTLKVAVNTILASTFRDNNLEYVNTIIEAYEEKFKSPKIEYVSHHTWSGRKVSRTDFNTCKEIYNILKNQTNYQLRIETSCINIYTNDDLLIESVVAVTKPQIYYVSKPATDKIKDYLLSSKFKIISASKPEYQFKITVNPLRNDVDSFIDWGKQMSGKVKLLSPPKYSEGYFYALDNKVVTLCRLFLGSKIRRVDELIYESEI